MINNMEKFLELRNKHKEFIYDSYKVFEDSEYICIEYKFEIPDLKIFTPSIKIKKKSLIVNNIENNKEYINHLVFHIGMIELISYWKCVCSPNVIIKCGKINDEQIKWFKKLYFYGLGELFFTNNIKTNINEFMNIICEGEKDYSSVEVNSNNFSFKNYIIPIGGGKDSVVTLELLKSKENKLALIINPKPVTLKCAELAEIEADKIIEVKRVIDKELLDLNSKGYINGHTPFSSVLAFISYLVAFLTGREYIALSNESSANESNVDGEKINHQYSKSYEFEKDFEEYSNKYLKLPIKYFSFLRPLNELQIAMIFSRYENYHKVFKSCNVGSKGEVWKWCCECPKCLFAYIMLSTFLYKEKIVNIFGKDMFEDKNMEETFIDLIGKGKNKPFECVGTYEEVNCAISKTIKNIEAKGEKLPYLLELYKENYKIEDISEELLKRYNNENNLSEEQEKILKGAIYD